MKQTELQIIIIYSPARVNVDNGRGATRDERRRGRRRLYETHEFNNVYTIHWVGLLYLAKFFTCKHTVKLQFMIMLVVITNINIIIFIIMYGFRLYIYILPLYIVAATLLNQFTRQLMHILIIIITS